MGTDIYIESDTTIENREQRFRAAMKIVMDYLLKQGYLTTEHHRAISMGKQDHETTEAIRTPHCIEGKE
jgi:hypothetical protein